MDLLRLPKPPTNDLKFMLRRFGPTCCLLLEGVQSVNALAQTNGVDEPKGPPIMILDHLKDSRAAEAFEGLRVWMFATELRDVQGVP
jgi:hypothetical protein